VQGLRFCTGRTAHRGSRGIGLPFHDHGTRRGWGVRVTLRPLFTPGERPRTHYTGGCVGPRDGLDRCEKSRPPPGFYPRTVKHVASRYTDWATPPTVKCIGHMKFTGENKITWNFGDKDNHFEYLRLSGNIMGLKKTGRLGGGYWVDLSGSGWRSVSGCCENGKAVAVSTNRAVRISNLWTCLLAFGYRWESNTQDVTDAVHVNHNVTKCTLGYEPFYVARVGAPDFDERFIGYGWTRNTQVH